MKHLGRALRLTALAALTTGGCVEVDGRWITLQEKLKLERQATAASSRHARAPAGAAAEPATRAESAPPEAIGEPEARGDAAADGAAVAEFVRRLAAKDHGRPDRALPAPVDREDPVAPFTEGSASSAANTSLAIPEPGEEGPLVASAPPPQATEPPRVEAVSIVSPVPAEQPDEADARTLSTNEPLDATEVVEEFSIRKYTEMLEEALRNEPGDVKLQWLLSTMRLVLGEDDRATAISPEIAREPGALLQDAIRLFADMRQLLIDPSHPADETLTALETLRAKLKDRAELVIPVVALCTRVRTFGVYDTMPSDQFIAYQLNRAVVYTEIKNLVSHRLEDGQYETVLAGRLELLTGDGAVVWHHDEDTIKEVSRQRREDFFLAQLVTFPSDLTPGDYVLKVMIEDLLGGKANEAHVEFSVSKSAMASATTG